MYNRRTDRLPVIASNECGTAVPKVPELVEELIASYLSGKTDAVELLHANFVTRSGVKRGAQEAWTSFPPASWCRFGAGVGNP